MSDPKPLSAHTQRVLLEVALRTNTDPDVVTAHLPTVAEQMRLDPLAHESKERRMSMYETPEDDPGFDWLGYEADTAYDRRRDAEAWAARGDDLRDQRKTEVPE